jgi:hypothetical protein
MSIRHDREGISTKSVTNAILDFDKRVETGSDINKSPLTIALSCEL